MRLGHLLFRHQKGHNTQKKVEKMTMVVAMTVREVIKKKNGKKAVRLTAWVDPPLPRSGQENVKISRQVVIFGVILPFYNGKNGPKFSQNRSGQAGGR